MVNRTEAPFRYCSMLHNDDALHLFRVILHLISLLELNATEDNSVILEKSTRFL